MKVLLTNHEYDLLYNAGADGAIAFFAHLRAVNKTYIKKAGKSGVAGTIRRRTGLSRTTIEKYLPIIKELNLIMVHHNGNIAVRGKGWTQKNLPRKTTTKLIPIIVSTSFADTKRSAFYVRVHSNIRRQEGAIVRKGRLVELLLKEPETLKELKETRRLYAKYGGENNSVENYCPNTTLSNARFDALRTGLERKRAGSYQKHRMIALGWMSQKRRIRRIAKDKRAIHFFEGETGVFLSKYGIFKEETPLISIKPSPFFKDWVKKNNILQMLGNKKKQVA